MKVAEDSWSRARLIPTSGINGQEEAERRATSALLAVMGSVREFGAAITRPLGAPGGAIRTFIEVPFRLGDRTVIPDGLIEASRGSKTWTALVEVKTGTAELHREQVEAYLDVARQEGYQAVLTISNQIAPLPGEHPLTVDRRKTRSVALVHLSWPELLTTAVQQRVHRGVSDPDQAWILEELIRYLEHPKSGAFDFSDMGQNWVPVREAIAAGTLRANDKQLPEVASRWVQLLRFLALGLGRELGADVQVHLSRRELADPASVIAAQCQQLAKDGLLTGAIKIPDAIGPLQIGADLRGGRITVSVDVDAPRDGRAATRVNWLTRQLRDAPDATRIDAWAANARTSTSEQLSALRESPLLLVPDASRPPRTFRVALTRPMGVKRSAGRGGFITSAIEAVDDFYSQVMQQLRPWSARPPQLPKTPSGAVAEAGIDLSAPSGDFENPPVRRDESTGSSTAATDSASVSDSSERTAWSPETPDTDD